MDLSHLVHDNPWIFKQKATESLLFFLEDVSSFSELKRSLKKAEGSSKKLGKNLFLSVFTLRNIKTSFQRPGREQLKSKQIKIFWWVFFIDYYKMLFMFVCLSWLEANRGHLNSLNYFLSGVWALYDPDEWQASLILGHKGKQQSQQPLASLFCLSPQHMAFNTLIMKEPKCQMWRYKWGIREFIKKLAMPFHLKDTVFSVSQI